MPKRFHKYRLLLDENFWPRQFFPQLNKIFDVKHITVDFKQESLPDLEIYQLAVSQKRIVVTFNSRDFKELANKSKDSGVIGVSANLTPSDIDKKLAALLMRATKRSLYGKFTYTSGETEV